MGSVRFSIIMPCYNSASYLREAVDSIVKQDYSDWDLIAVNDGSTDETLNILDSYSKKDKRIKVFSKKNGGYATAVNNPDTTISFIFAKDMFAQKGYSSMYEANQINGVYFAGPAKTEGYIDDFGCWQTYTWTDYFERIFNTRNKDVKMRMYMAMQLAK